MDRERLYGDAKATARAADTQHRQRVLATAEKAYHTEHTPETRMAYARALLDVGRYKDAEVLLAKLLEDTSGDIQLTCDMAFACKKLNQLERAKEMFRKVIEIDPKHSLARCAENELWMLDSSYRPSWMRAEK